MIILILLIAPFWISYMMRMLAWIDLLQTNGYMNQILGAVGLPGNTNWLGGRWYTVVLGLVYGYIPYMILVLYAGLDRIDGSLLEAGRDLGLSRARTFVKVTLPLSRQPILTGMLITVLPMLGDYFTNTAAGRHEEHRDDRQRHPGAARRQRLPGPGRGALAAPGRPARRADDLVRAGHSQVREGGVMTRPRPHAAGHDRGPGATGLPWPKRNPWRHPWLLEGFTWLYLTWSLVPIGLAVLFSFNNGRSQSVWQGFSWRWYFTDQVNSVAHSNVLQLAVLQTLKLSAYTTLIAVPLGLTFALGIHRWRTRTSASFNFVMLLSFVIPELIFGVAMFFVFTSLFQPVGLGTLAETLALVTWNVSWPAIIVQARLATIGNTYTEAAADLGARRFRPSAGSWCRCSRRRSSPAPCSSSLG